MKRPYSQFIGLISFEPRENSRGGIIKECNEVVVAQKAVDLLPVYTGNPISIKVFGIHNGLFASGGVLRFETAGGNKKGAGLDMQQPPPNEQINRSALTYGAIEIAATPQ